jgi:hypothetical protein
MVEDCDPSVLSPFEEQDLENSKVAQTTIEDTTILMMILFQLC